MVLLWLLVIMQTHISHYSLFKVRSAFVFLGGLFILLRFDSSFRDTYLANFYFMLLQPKS